ncbi:hypothetical protein AAMO2058_001227700 [Amorphochlora amoebiformis]
MVSASLAVMATILPLSLAGIPSRSISSSRSLLRPGYPRRSMAVRCAKSRLRAAEEEGLRRKVVLRSIMGSLLASLPEAGFAAENVGSVDDYNLNPDSGAINSRETFSPQGTTAQAYFEYPSLWKPTDSNTQILEPGGSRKNWFKFKEPISGNPVFSQIEIQSKPVMAKTVEDFGRPEANKFLDLVTEGDPELQQADLMVVDVRKESGVTYYDYKLAYSPRSCSYEEAKKFWGTCPIKTLAYISTAIADGHLFRFIARTNLNEWGNFAKQQPAVWKSFRVTPMDSS